MEPLTRFRKKYAERISDFTKASFAARIKRFSAAAAEQWGLFQDLRRFQIAFLIYGAALLALLMAAQMWASRAVGRLQARNIENQNLVDKDQLTGLFNRRSFEQELSKHSAKTGNAPKLIAIDIDRFRSVNELVGTAMGDRLLIQIGQRIREAAPGCVVGRMGPDEFLILAQGSPAYIDAIIENVIVGAGAPVDFGDRMYTPSLSIVCVDVALDGASENPIKAVNTAMLEAKRQGGGKVVRFETAMMNDVRDRNLMESDLPGAIHARALEIVAQPKILLADESICGFETLVRWNHPKLGWVSPEKFCTLADSIGLSSSLGLAVADMAFGLASTLKFEFGRDRRMSINVSPAFGSHPDFVPNIKSLLAKHHLSPSDVEFEVTEEALASELGPILDNMSQLRALGCAIAIDDFGKGHSNIGRLTSLPVTVLKLDKSLVQGAADALPSRGIMRGLVQLARELNVELLVEGVETEAQAQLLRELGVTRVQGYFYARPMSPLKLLSWLRQRDSERQGPRMAKAVA
jgi:diguanylate cyclase (GGDEF)-like protein